MNPAPGDRRIFWMVRLLVALGLAMVAVLLGQIGTQLQAIRTARVRFQNQQDHLSQASEEMFQRGRNARREIRAVLDNGSASLEIPSAAANFSLAVQGLLKASRGTSAADTLKRLDALADDLQNVERRAGTWRVRYDAVWPDVSEKRTLSQVRKLITDLRASAEIMEGKRRLQEAIEFRHWRKAEGADAVRQADTILAAQANRQSRGVNAFKNQLTEVARLVEAFVGEEDVDNLADLKDNQLKPALDRLSYDAQSLPGSSLEESVATQQGIQNLAVAFFGREYKIEEARQNVVVGAGGLYSSWQNTLALRRESGKIKDDLTLVSHESDAAGPAFAQATQAGSKAPIRVIGQCQKPRGAA